MSRTHKDSKWGRKKLGRDEWYSPVPSSFKRTNRQIMRSKEKQAIREEKEPPIFKKTDWWDWW